jgi:hypothetical protein
LRFGLRPALGSGLGLRLRLGFRLGLGLRPRFGLGLALRFGFGFGFGLWLWLWLWLWLGFGFGLCFGFGSRLGRRTVGPGEVVVAGSAEDRSVLVGASAVPAHDHVVISRSSRFVLAASDPRHRP